jgi:hypothetical protein
MDAPTALATALQNPAGPALLAAAGLLARVTLAFETCAHGLLPTVEFKTRLALSLIVTLAALRRRWSCPRWRRPGSGSR